MRFLVDAQLPRRLAHGLREVDHEALHTLDLPLGNRTSDAEITRRADADGCTVVTKDADFVAGHVLYRAPRRLLVSVGDLPKRELEALLPPRLGTVEKAFADGLFVEVTQSSLIVHG